jgi:hypothetical protein
MSASPQSDQSFTNLNVGKILTANKSVTNIHNTNLFGCPQTIINIDCNNISPAISTVNCDTICGRINLTNMNTDNALFASIILNNKLANINDTVLLSFEFQYQGFSSAGSTVGLDGPVRDNSFGIIYTNFNGFQKNNSITIVFMLVKHNTSTTQTLNYVVTDTPLLLAHKQQQSLLMSSSSKVSGPARDIVKLPHENRDVSFIDRRISQSAQSLSLLDKLLEKSKSYANPDIARYLVSEVNALIANSGPDQRWVVVSQLYNEVMGAIMGTWQSNDAAKITMGIHFDPTRPENVTEKVYTLFLKYMAKRGIKTIMMKNIGGDTVVKSTLSAAQNTPFKCFRETNNVLEPLTESMSALEIVLVIQ